MPSPSLSRQIRPLDTRWLQCVTLATDLDIVVIDNVSAHNVSGIQDAIEAAGPALLCPPSYLSDHAPVETCWSECNASLQSMGTP